MRGNGVLGLCIGLSLASACGGETQHGARGTSGASALAGTAGAATPRASSAGAAAAGGASPSARDPGMPGTTYGTVCSLTVDLRDGSPPKHLSGTAAAVSRSTGAHLFVIQANDTDTLPRVYISILLTDATWQVGTHSRALAGRIEIATPDGWTYVLDPARPELGRFSLEVTRAALAETGDHHYLTGTLKAELPNATGKPPGALLSVTMN